MLTFMTILRQAIAIELLAGVTAAPSRSFTLAHSPDLAADVARCLTPQKGSYQSNGKEYVIVARQVEAFPVETWRLDKGE